MFSSIILLNLLIPQSLQECSPKKEYYQIYPSEIEIYNWDLEDFFDGFGLTYSLNDTIQRAFVLINPVENTGGKEEYYFPVSQIVSTKAYSYNSFWSNEFVFLFHDNNSFYLGFSNQSKQAPQFNTIYKIDDITDGLNCFDFEFLSNESYLVDCQIGISEIVYNIFYFISKPNSTQIFKEESITTAFNGRQLEKYTIQGQYQLFTYLVQTTPSDFINSSGLIEIYSIDSFGIPRNTGYVLDYVVMSYLLNLKSEDLEFNIVDVQVLDNGDIFILDAQSNIYIINFVPNGLFKLKNKIQTKITEAFAFYVKYYGQNYEEIVILGSQFIETITYDQVSLLYHLPFETTYSYPTKIEKTHEFIVISIQSQSYILFIDKKYQQLILQQTFEQMNTLLNPQFPDLLILTNGSVSRYSLQKNQLQYKGANFTEEIKYIKITARANSLTQNSYSIISSTLPKNDQNICSITIMYKVIKNQDNTIYQLDLNIKIFPQFLTSQQIWQIEKICSGPNQNYKILRSAPVRSSVSHFLQLNLPSKNELVFQYVQIGKQSNYFYKVEQYQNGNLQIMNCTHDSIYTSETQQNELIKLEIDTILTKRTFQIWEGEKNQIYFAYVVGNCVLFKKLQGKIAIDVATVFFTSNPTILQLNNYIYALSDEIIHALSKQGDMLTQTNIDILQKQGYKGKWIPNKIFGNKQFNQHLLFVLHVDHICILDFHNEFSFINQITFEHQFDDAELAIGVKTFFVITKSKISEYNYEIQNNIFQIKQFDYGSLGFFYEADLTKLDFSSDTGYLYLILNNDNDWNDEYCILVFAPNQPLNDACVTQLAVGYSKISSITVSGTNETMYVLVATNRNSSYFSFMTRPLVTLAKDTSRPILKNKQTLQLQVYNLRNSIIIEEDIMIVDAQTKLFIDSQKFKNYNSIEIENTTQIIIQGIGNDWYFGQITQFFIECSQCGRNQGIEIIQQFDSYSFPVIYDYDIRSLIDTDLFQATKALIVFQEEEIKLIIQLNFKWINYECRDGTSNEQYVLSLCHNGQQYTIYAVDKLGLNGWVVLGEKFKIGTSIQKIQLIENNILILMKNDSLIINHLNTYSDWELLEIFTIDLKLIQKHFTKINQFTPNDFIVVKANYANSRQYYKILITCQQGLFIEDFYYKGDLFLFTPLYLDFIDLSNELLKKNQFIMSSTSFQQIKSLTDFQDNQLQIFIQTSDVMHFGLSIIFQGTDYVIYSSLIVNFYFNRYADWKTINKIAIASHFIAIPYQNGQTAMIAVYPRIWIQNTAMIGSYNWSTSKSVIPQELCLFVNDNHLYLQQEKTLQRYTVIEQPSLKFTISSSSILTSQTIKIWIKNDFDQVQEQLQLQVTQSPNPPDPPPTPTPTPDPQDDSNKILNIFWWIILCLSAVLTLGAIGYLIHRLKNRNVYIPIE